MDHTLAEAEGEDEHKRMFHKQVNMWQNDNIDLRCESLEPCLAVLKGLEKVHGPVSCSQERRTRLH
ncbi:conserved hypothetical protein [Ricinus communis]|uniref:Uncharacterized protein n=1 Tax=Ricinus communis TaxID=3988 RepID=B9RPF4_RICCO|nr:conserved hypothetical protein [Ricinus communis]